VQHGLKEGNEQNPTMKNERFDNWDLSKYLLVRVLHDFDYTIMLSKTARIKI
jgi:hypothetical protein